MEQPPPPTASGQSDTKDPRSGATVHGGWIRGNTVVPADQLSLLLREAAQHHARRALVLHTSTDDFDLLDAAAFAGSAVELIAKACIATVEPAALAKPVGTGDGFAVAEHVMRLRGHGVRLTKSPLNRVVTIDASVALAISGKLFAQLTPHSQSAASALEVRNDALHLGLVEPGLLRTAVAAMTNFARAALPVLGVEDEAFWGTATQVNTAATILQARADELAEIVENKIERAQHRYGYLIGRLGADESRHVVRGLEERGIAASGSGYGAQCPACDNRGWVEVEADYDVESDGEGGHVGFQTDSWVAGFHCPVCDLTLDSEEAAEAGFGNAEDDEDPHRD
ncbi:MAG: hypothetical protein ACOH17_04325 [Cellulomonas sp.]